MVYSRSKSSIVLIISTLNMVAHGVYGLAMHRVMSFFFFIWMGAIIPFIVMIFTIVFMIYKRTSNGNLWGIIWVNGVLIIGTCYYLDRALSRH